MNLSYVNWRFLDIKKAKKDSGYSDSNLEDFVYDAIMNLAYGTTKKQ